MSVEPYTDELIYGRRAPIVFHDTRNPQPTAPGDDRWPYLSDGDRRTRKRWPVPDGQLWERITEETTCPGSP